MSKTIIVDTGPLIASINNKDQYHKWARTQSLKLPLPYITCESVLSEAWHMLRGTPEDQERLLRLLDNKDVIIDFDFSSEIDSISALLRRYANVPMSVADACLVRMSELINDCLIFSTDSDFHIYRRHGNKTIPSILPPSK